MPTRVLKASRLVSNAWIIMAVGLGLILAAAISVAVLVARSDEADRLVTHTFEVQQEAHTLLAELRTAENGQRGYVLTQNEAYLKPVDVAVPRCPASCRVCARRTADNPSQQARLNRVEPLIGPRIDVIRRSIELTRQGDRDAAIALVATGRGKDLMEEITAEMQQFDREEKGLLAASARGGEKTEDMARNPHRSRLARGDGPCRRSAVATRQAVTGLLDRTRELELNPGFGMRQRRRSGRRSRWKPWDSSAAALPTTSTIS